MTAAVLLRNEVHATGEPRATVTIEQLVALTPLITRIAMSIVHDAGLAEDVAQEAILRAWTHRDGFRGEATLRAWVARITTNAALSMVRKRRDRPTDTGLLDIVPDTSAGPERTADSHAGLDDLWQALERLPPVSRAVIVLREIDGLSYEEIAIALDLPLSTVKTRLFRGRRTLANELRAWE